MSVASASTNCEMPILVLPIEQGEEVPEATENYLITCLTNIAAASGLAADSNYGQFFIGGKFNHIYKDVLPGPPTQTALHTTLTIYVGDAQTRKIFSSKSIDLRGAGTTEQRAFINAMKSMKAHEQELTTLLDKAKSEILNYFEKNYTRIISEAQRDASKGEYEKALWNITSIPSCCSGYDKAVQASVQIYRQYIGIFRK